MGIKLNFNSKTFSKDLERQLKKHMESEAKRNPAQFLKGHEGEKYAGTCPKCGHNAVTITHGGYGACPECGHTAKISLNVTWK